MIFLQRVLIAPIWQRAIVFGAICAMMLGCDSSAQTAGQETTDAAGEGGTQPVEAATTVADASDGASTFGRDAAPSEAAIPDGAPAVSCATRAGKRGLTQRSATVAGLDRSYLVYLPAKTTPTTPIPFVYVFQGSTMSGQEMYQITQYTALADSENIAVVFPDGEQGPGSVTPWNVEMPGQEVCGLGQWYSGTGDDFAFLDALKDDVSLDQCIDQAHVYATGFSMGAYFAHHIACYRSEIRAVAPHSGGTIADLSSCTTSHVPILMLQGTADPSAAAGCQDLNSAPEPGFPPAATLWAARNGCSPSYTVVPADSDAGGNGQCYVYNGCPTGGQVELCTFTDMGHCWAGGDPNAPSYSCPTYASATLLQWNFFKKYAW
jgi:polyhydroxybutyrate depolymerase